MWAGLIVRGVCAVWMCCGVVRCVAVRCAAAVVAAQAAVVVVAIVKGSAGRKRGGFVWLATKFKDSPGLDLY